MSGKINEWGNCPRCNSEMIYDLNRLYCSSPDICYVIFNLSYDRMTINCDEIFIDEYAVQRNKNKTVIMWDRYKKYIKINYIVDINISKEEIEQIILFS